MTEPAAPPACTGTDPAWGLGEVAIGLLLAAIGGSISSSLALTISGESAFSDLSIAWLALAQTGLWLGLLGAPVWASATKGWGRLREFRLRATWGDVGVGIGIGAGLQILILPLLYLPLLDALDKTRRDVEEPARALSDQATGTVGAVLLILIVGIAAPVVEEVFYRGLFQQALLKRAVPPAAAIGINAFVFAVTHFQLLQLPALFIFGVAAGWLAWWRGRLGAAIAAHITFNMVTVVALLIT